MTSRLSHSASRSIEAGDLARRSGRPLDVGIHERAGGRPDGGERRPQVMGDGIEQRRLERVAAPRDLGGRRLAPRAGRARAPRPIWSAAAAMHPRLPRVGIAQLPRPIDPDGAERSIAGGDGDAIRRLVAGRARRLGVAPGGVHPDPLGGLVAGASAERGVRPAGSSAPRAGRCGVGHDRLTHHHPDAVGLDLVAHHPGDRARADPGSRSVASVKRDVEQRPRLALALGRRDRPFALAPGQAADHDPHDEQQDEVQPLARVLDREGVERLDEEEVVDEERPDRGGHRRPGAAQRPRPRRPRG